MRAEERSGRMKEDPAQLGRMLEDTARQDAEATVRQDAEATVRQDAC